MARPSKDKELRVLENRVGEMIKADHALVEARGPDYEIENALFFNEATNSRLAKEVIEVLKNKEKTKSKKRKREENEDEEIEPLNEGDVDQMINNIVTFL
jgi:hypothetical protein